MSRREKLQNPRPRLQLWLSVLAIVVAVVAVALSGGLVSEAPPEPGERPFPTVQVVDPVLHPYRRTTSGWGRARPRIKLLVSAQVSGIVLPLSNRLEPGDPVDAGDLLVSIEDTDYRLALTMAEAALSSAELHLTQQQAEAAVAELDARELPSELGPTPLTLRQPQLAEARARVAAAQAQVDQARLDLRRARVVAPMAARILDRHIEPGQLVQNGDPLITLQSLDSMEIPVSVSPQEVPWLSTAKTIVAWVGSDETGSGQPQWRGFLDHINPEVDRGSGMAVAVVRLDLPRGPEPDDATTLHSGMVTHVRFLDPELSQGYWLPRSALTADRRLVYLRPDGTLHSWLPEPAFVDDAWIVLQDLPESDIQLCLDPPELFVEGMRAIPKPVPKGPSPPEPAKLAPPSSLSLPRPASPSLSQSTSLAPDSLSSASATPRPSGGEVEAWSVVDSEPGFEILLTGAAPEAVDSYAVDLPDRWVVDLRGLHWPHAPDRLDLPSPYGQARLALYRDEPPVVRVAVDLPSGQRIRAPSIEQYPGGLRIAFLPADAHAAPQSSERVDP